METATLKLRQAKIELKTTTEVQEFLGRAAALDGVDLTSFLLGPAIEKANRLLREHECMMLAEQGQLALVHAIHVERQPTQAMKDILDLPDLPVCKGMSIDISAYDPALTYKDQSQFDCGHPLINSFVRKYLKTQLNMGLSVAYVLLDPTDGDRFVGFYTLAQYTIDLSRLSYIQIGQLPQNIPCTRLEMLGIDKGYMKQGLGSSLMKHALKLTQSVCKQIGGLGLCLNAEPPSVDFYQKLGFALVADNKADNPSPMFLSINLMR